MRSGNARRVVALLTIGIFATLLTGCLPQATHPDFALPVSWAGENGPGIDFNGSMLLREDGSAKLVNIPQGQWTQTSTGICWKTSGGEYTGEATWRVWSKRGVEVEFEDSDVIVWADPGKFGSFSWSSLKIVNCDGSSWGMELTCGQAGGITQADCTLARRKP